MTTHPPLLTVNRQRTYFSELQRQYARRRQHALSGFDSSGDEDESDSDNKEQVLNEADHDRDYETDDDHELSDEDDSESDGTRHDLDEDVSEILDRNHLDTEDESERRSRHLLPDEDAVHAAQSSDEDVDDDELAVPTIEMPDVNSVSSEEEEDGIPPFPFPHAPAPEKKASVQAPSLQAQLAELNPPLFFHGGPGTEKRGEQSFLVRHVGVLTAILHRCMLEDDWVRARRAWTLLMRTDYWANEPNLRKHKWWAIGAQILEATSTSETLMDDDEYPDEKSRGDYAWAQMRRYYEEFILEYPASIRKSANVNALVLYPAMFSTWIYHVQEMSDRRRKEYYDGPATKAALQGGDDAVKSEQEDSYIKTEPRDGPTLPLSERFDPLPGAEPDSDVEYYENVARLDRILKENIYESAELEPDKDDASTQQEVTIEVKIRRTELRHAVAMANRIDDLLRQPHFDRSRELMRLRGFIGLWIADLCHLVDGEVDHRAAKQNLPELSAREEERGKRLLKKLQDRGHHIGIKLEPEIKEEDAAEETATRQLPWDHEQWRW